MGFNSGIVNQRTYPELEVIRNYNPTFPEGFTHTARVASGTTILSGQLIVLNSSGEWELASNISPSGNLYSTPTLEVFVALKDGVSYDALAVAGADYDASQGVLGPNGAGFSDTDTSSTGGTFMSPTGGVVVGYSTQGQYLLQSAFFDTTGKTYTPGTTFLTVSDTNKGNIMPATVNTVHNPIIGRVDRVKNTLDGINSNVPSGTYVLTWKTGYFPNSATT